MSRVAVVTGGAKGIGRAISDDLAADGFTVVVTGRDEAALDACVAELRGGGFTADRAVIDVGNPASVLSSFAAIHVQHGTVDVLVNCAGVVIRSDAEATTDEDWNKVLATDLNGPFWCARAVAPHMLEAGRGAIINVGSIAALLGISGRASYTTAKAGLTGLTRTLALEWAAGGVRVNTVAPGWTLTDMVQSGFDAGRLDRDALLSRIPMQRLAEPREISAVVAFLASDRASYLTGQVVVVDGGFAVNGDCP